MRKRLRARSATLRMRSGLPSLRPFEDDDFRAVQKLAHERHVELAARVIDPMRRSRYRIAACERGYARAAADREHRQSAARFAHCPVEQRIMAARDDRRPRLQGRDRRALRGDPGVDLLARKEQLAGGAHVRNRTLAHEVVDAPLLEAQIRGHLARIHQRRRACRRRLVRV
jgi:hypothetical protein